MTQRYLKSNRFIVGTFSILVAVIIFSAQPAFTQGTADTVSFEQGMQLYQKAEFKEAATVFSQLPTPEAKLFAGKSHFSAGNYLKAQQFLGELKPTDPASLYNEGLYTTALTAFQLHQFEKAIRLLDQVKSGQQIDNELKRDAREFYADLLSYLTLNQIKEVFIATTDSGIRLDIMASLVGRVDFATLSSLFKKFTPYLPDTTEPSLQYEQLQTTLADSVSYRTKYATTSYNRDTPEGISYEIGVALPLFDAQSAKFNVSRGLYNGILLAAEEYNQEHADRKVFIRFHSSNPAQGSVESVFNQLVWNRPLDAVIGPLFSESAYRMADLAEQYKVTMMTPLANSDTLNLDNPYVYQMNPTFSVRGRKMARYAVNNLGLDTMAVIAQKNSLGYESAFAFRDQAERMGAKIVYFLVEDFAASAYDLSDYTKYFTADEKMRDSLNIKNIDAIYAPFTGKASHTLIDLLTTDLEAANSDATLLGSAEWGTFDMGSKRRKKFDIYYPESDPLSSDTSRYGKFDRKYSNRFGISSTKFSYIGYDTAHFLLETLHRVGNPALLNEALKNQPLHQGLTGPIDFRGRHINQELEIKKISPTDQ